jgi:hypothetical protein
MRYVQFPDHASIIQTSSMLVYGLDRARRVYVDQRVMGSRGRNVGYRARRGVVGLAPPLALRKGSAFPGRAVSFFSDEAAPQGARRSLALTPTISMACSAGRRGVSLYDPRP